MTPEIPKTYGQSVENSLSQYEERYGKLRGEILGTLRPNSALIIFCSDSKHPLDNNTLLFNADGSWTYGFGIESLVGPVKNASFREILQKYAIVTSTNLLPEESSDIRDEANRFDEVKMAAIKSANDDPIPFAAGLLDSRRW